MVEFFFKDKAKKYQREKKERIRKEIKERFKN